MVNPMWMAIQNPVVPQILQKTQKQQNTDNQRILKPKYDLSGAQFLHLACQGGKSPLCHPSVTPSVGSRINKSGI